MRIASSSTCAVLCQKKDKDKPDLQLTGSQIRLTCRPKLNIGKASSRFVPVFNNHVKRPMSAMSTFGHQAVRGHSETCNGGWKRPHSANNSYFSGGDHSVSSSTTSECVETSGRIAYAQCDDTYHRNKVPAKFPLLGENLHNCATEKELPDRQTDDNVTELDHGFGATHILPSSQLECLTSELLGCTRTGTELKNCCDKLGIKNSFCNKYEPESLSSDCSNVQCHSETSLGEQIIAKAHDPQPAELPSILPLKQELASKPTLNNDDILFGTFNHVYSPVDKLQYLNQTTHSLDNDVLVSGVEDGNSSHMCSMKNLISMVFSDGSDICQRNLVNNVTEDMFITQKCSNIKDEIPMNTQYSSQHGEKRQNFNEQCQNELELKHYLYTQNPAVLSRTCNAFDDVFNYVGDIKVQHWFQDSVCEVVKEPKAHIFDTERQTDLLLMNLATEKCSSKCSDNCERFGMRARHDSDSRVHFGKPRRQEFHLNSLVDEDIGSSSINVDGSDKRCSVSNIDSHRVNVDKSDAVLNLELRTTKKSLLTSQRREETDSEQLKISSSHGEFEGNGNISHKMSNVSKSEENDKSADLNIECSVASTGKESPTSSLNTQLEILEQHEQIRHIPKESARSLDPKVALQLNLEVFSMQHDVLEKSNIPYPLDRGNDLPAPTSLPHDTYDLNVFNVDLSGNSTYDDIISILKVLEQEETCSGSEAFLNTDVLDSAQNVSVTSGKLCDILTYLDKVEQGCGATLESAKGELKTVNNTTQNNDLKLTTMPRVEELLNLSKVDLAHEVLALHLQLEEKSNSFNLLQETLHEQRKLTLRNTRNINRDVKKKLHEQKEEYEAVVARHQKFIDQLIADKKNLSEKCESLVFEVKKSEENHKKTLKAVEERHSVELQRTREMHAAGEKLRRDRWIDNKTQKIKEMTVKSLEPELERMNTRHQQELSDLRLLHKQELDDLEIRASRKTSQQMEQLRDQLTAEKEQALAKEKELLSQRIEKQVEQEELEYQARRRRFLGEIRREKERLAEEETRMSKELEETKQNLSRENAKVIERLKQEHKETMEACSRKHQNEVKSLKEALEIEKEAWMHSYKKDLATHISEQESELRNQYKRERDKEIELVIERLESDATRSRVELEQAMDNRLRRLKEKFDAEVKDLEDSEKSIKTKYNETKGKLVEKEDEVISLKANVRQLGKELEEARKIVDRLSGERTEVKEIVRREFINQMAAAEHENIRLREEMVELRTRHRMELSSKVDEVARMMTDKEEQLQQVYNRYDGNTYFICEVKLAVAKRDETIQKLKSQHESALKRCSHLEELLEQQR
ncbi:centrosomal protein of 131 kDa-like isoform X3 [Zootermopsis nevadensis]|uniref:centrosomal protein of 131 kDa-like isoform X3 n=1 Tax=Zootermopsis nevadensis TaxID=136037 RepID=UPI000B8E6118|nr:centrosomal protein of 131 kDa-like isoform X3 [Zootermopsis nevadensis]